MVCYCVRTVEHSIIKADKAKHSSSHRMAIKCLMPRSNTMVANWLVFSREGKKTGRLNAKQRLHPQNHRSR